MSSLSIAGYELRLKLLLSVAGNELCLVLIWQFLWHDAASRADVDAELRLVSLFCISETSLIASFQHDFVLLSYYALLCVSYQHKENFAMVLQFN